MVIVISHDRYCFFLGMATVRSFVWVSSYDRFFLWVSSHDRYFCSKLYKDTWQCNMGKVAHIAFGWFHELFCQQIAHLIHFLTVSNHQISYISFVRGCVRSTNKLAKWSNKLAKWSNNPNMIMVGYDMKLSLSGKIYRTICLCSGNITEHINIVWNIKPNAYGT